ncbi:MAG: hypothetical protein KKA67_09795 [Spirochaetes bacterium]|nr:hypothetical protein [Spirochaetota bacterium]MBU1081062.1 hypothetical protein [Spirochaetota bacterium]
MDALQDRSWMRQLYASSPAERFERGKFSVVCVSVAPSDAHHFDRYRYRLFYLEKGGSEPVLAVDLESDILGSWRLTVSTAEGSRIRASFDVPPGYEAFKAAALAAADETLGATGRGRPGNGDKEPRSGGVSHKRPRRVILGP